MRLLFTAFLTLSLAILPASQAMDKPASHTKGTPTGKPTGPLQPGEYWWSPRISPNGPVVVLVSLPQQIMNVYRNGILVGRSSISTGSRNYPTPTGVFTILEKKRTYYSNKYENSPMPHMQRLTWSGVAFHSGFLPGYAASHGCIRLPYDFSKLLFDLTREGGTVVIGDAKSAQPYFAADPGVVLSSKDPSHGVRRLGKNNYEWNFKEETKEKNGGPITILISGSDRTLYVTRNGARIGRAAVEIRGVGKLGDHLYTLLDGSTGKASLWAPGRAGHRWMVVDTGPSNRQVNVEAIAKRIRFNPTFATQLHDMLSPGTTLIVTDLPAERKPLSCVALSNK